MFIFYFLFYFLLLFYLIVIIVNNVGSCSIFQISTEANYQYQYTNIHCTIGIWRNSCILIVKVLGRVNKVGGGNISFLANQAGQMWVKKGNNFNILMNIHQCQTHVHCSSHHTYSILRLGAILLDTVTNPLEVPHPVAPLGRRLKSWPAGCIFH